MAPRVEVDHVIKWFATPARRNAPTLALDGVSFQVEPGSILAIVGPSGCGKTTLINLLGGFLKPDGGRILMNGRRVEGPGTDRVVVFQNYALFDWKTALDNVALGLRAKGLPRNRLSNVARRYLEMVHLGDAGDLFPHQLSGGMKQRLALARALAVEPQCLLLDEPLAALDHDLRSRMAQELIGIVETAAITLVMVTHDVDEAILAADRIVLLSPAPGSVRRVLDVDLPRPRTIAMTQSPEFWDMRREVMESTTAATGHA
jgi:NitT/TauT family transport system ATP-binding protein